VAFAEDLNLVHTKDAVNNAWLSKCLNFEIVKFSFGYI
jgi:hypothetical protein